MEEGSDTTTILYIGSDECDEGYSIVTVTCTYTNPNNQEVLTATFEVYVAAVEKDFICNISIQSDTEDVYYTNNSYPVVVTLHYDDEDITDQFSAECSVLNDDYSYTEFAWIENDYFSASTPGSYRIQVKIGPVVKAIVVEVTEAE